jgi:hypothetical protein
MINYSRSYLEDNLSNRGAKAMGNVLPLNPPSSEAKTTEQSEAFGEGKKTPRQQPLADNLFYYTCVVQPTYTLRPCERDNSFKLFRL